MKRDAYRRRSADLSHELIRRQYMRVAIAVLNLMVALFRERCAILSKAVLVIDTAALLYEVIWYFRIRGLPDDDEIE
ncbi:MAG: hypothetical protein IJE08_11070 [Clostridia bacterium]|nr:hypothetical protein [Clostridia bacterium]